MIDPRADPDGQKDRRLWIAIREAALQVSAAHADRMGLPRYLGEQPVPPITERELLHRERRAWQAIIQAIDSRYGLALPRKARKLEEATHRTSEYTGG